MAAALSELERLQIRVALEDLNTAFCYHLDHDDVDALLELFVDDVYYTHGSRVSRGQAELEQVFRSRSAATKRTRATCTPGSSSTSRARRAPRHVRLHDVRRSTASRRCRRRSRRSSPTSSTLTCAATTADGASRSGTSTASSWLPTTRDRSAQKR